VSAPQLSKQRRRLRRIVRRSPPSETAGLHEDVVLSPPGTAASRVSVFVPSHSLGPDLGGSRRWNWSYRSLANLDLVTDDSNGECFGSNLGLGIVHPQAIADAELPGVPGANDIVAIDIPVSQRCPHMRATIVDGVVVSIPQEDGNHPAIYRKCPALPFSN